MAFPHASPDSTFPTETDLKGKRVLVTGGTTGIGRAIVRQLGEREARIVTFGRHEPELKDSLEHVNATGAEIHGLIADVAYSEGVETVFTAVDATLDGLDILIANAGIAADGIADMSDADWRYAVNTNLCGYMACAAEAITRMKASGGGHIVFIGSISAKEKSANSSVYAATKAGVAAFAETLRKEVQGDNIRITLIEPGSVGADMQEMAPHEQREAIDKHEMLYAEELADTVIMALTRAERVNIVSMRVEPRMEKSR